jgi:peptidoglycan/xylan/chitin deacetylase (PgdA/CDA1 family)
MNISPSHRQESGDRIGVYPHPVRFCFDGDLGDFLYDQFLDDAQSAKFSPAFRMFYHVRRMIPAPIRQRVQQVRNRRLKVPTRWYIPANLEEFLLRRDRPVPSLWPQEAEYALVLTHDVEEQSGFDFILHVADIEEKLGLRSCWNIVPHKYRIDHGILNELRARGHEIAVHGYNHDGRLFLTKSIFDHRVGPINEAVKQLGACGFRSPMVHRNLNWMQALDIGYDASCFDIDPYQAMPGGVQGIWPFRVGRFVELPYTMPQDHTLFITLKESSTRIWQEKLHFLRKHHGMALMLTHADYLTVRQGLQMYERFLTETCETTRPWHVLPREMAAWFAEYEEQTPL